MEDNGNVVELRPTIVKDHEQNFRMLEKAFLEGHVGMAECRVKATGEIVAAICTFHKENGEIVMTPFAVFLNGNPFELLEPPTVGGFENGWTEPDPRKS